MVNVSNRRLDKRGTAEGTAFRSCRGLGGVWACPTPTASGHVVLKSLLKAQDDQFSGQTGNVPCASVVCARLVVPTQPRALADQLRVEQIQEGHDTDLHALGTRVTTTRFLCTVARAGAYWASEHDPQGQVPRVEADFARGWNGVRCGIRGM